MQDCRNEIEVVLANREFLYRYAARAFSAEPDNAMLEVIADCQTLQQCLLFDDGGGLLVGAEVKIRDSLRPGIELDKLADEYTRLFVGPAALPVPPWESVFVSKEPVLFNEVTLAVRKAYRNSGFRASGYPHEADDHVATELNFMAALCAKARDAAEVGGEKALSEIVRVQLTFLEEHLLVWIREFSDRLKEVDGISSFYPSFASLAVLVCERDAEVIQELLAVV